MKALNISIEETVRLSVADVILPIAKYLVEKARDPFQYFPVCTN